MKIIITNKNKIITYKCNYRNKINIKMYTPKYSILFIYDLFLS